LRGKFGIAGNIVAHTAIYPGRVNPIVFVDIDGLAIFLDGIVLTIER